MNAIAAGQPADRWPWIPSIYEHGARLLDRSPGEAGRNASLMAEAALTGYRIYRHDLVTVGIDIYNIEAEAFGCELSTGEGRSIPAVAAHPLSGPKSPEPARLKKLSHNDMPFPFRG